MVRRIWGDDFVSDAPQINLVEEGSDGRENFDSDLSIAAAKTCYSKSLVLPEDLKNFEDKREFMESIWEPGHHTPFMHKNFTFSMENISRQAIWSFFHAHPFYNSEQVSQRYKKMGIERTVIPKLDEEQDKIFRECLELQFGLYENFRDKVLFNPASEFYFERFPNKRSSENVDGEIKKRTQEVARYFLPLGTHAHLYHSVNLVTLCRYQRAVNSSDVPEEVGFIVQEMIDRVLEKNPDYAFLFKGEIEKEKTLEWLFARSLFNSERGNESIIKWAEEFDSKLGGRNSVLIDSTHDGIKNMANSVRNMFGLREQELSDEFAIGVLFEKIYNKGRADIVTLDHVSKLTRAEYMPHFTFAVKLSHSADSQAQRQRMSPATRPLLEYVVSDKPDYIIPSLVRAADAVELYREGMKQIWEKRNELVNKGVERHIANYLLPNAVSIRYYESVDLLNFLQKNLKRECLNAQEEIGRITLEQRQDIEKIHPELKGIFGPPCYIRRNYEVTPFCPEGKRYCGVPVWLGGKYSIEEVMKGRKI